MEKKLWLLYILQIPFYHIKCTHQMSFKTIKPKSGPIYRKQVIFIHGNKCRKENRFLKVRSHMAGRTRAENWLQHKSLHVFTHAGRGAEAEREENPLRKKWVQHPICRVRFETARSKPSLSSRNGRSAPRPLRVRSAYV